MTGTPMGQDTGCKVQDTACLKKDIVVDKTKTAAGINEAIAAGKAKKAKDDKADAVETRASGLVQRLDATKKDEVQKKNDTIAKLIGEPVAAVVPQPMAAQVSSAENESESDKEDEDDDDDEDDDSDSDSDDDSSDVQESKQLAMESSIDKEDVNPTSLEQKKSKTSATKSF